jgi:hypothetical protein
MEQELTRLLSMLDVPFLRRDVSSEANLRWLHRNLEINNAGLPETAMAMELIVKLLQEKS